MVGGNNRMHWVQMDKITKDLKKLQIIEAGLLDEVNTIHTKDA